MRRRQNAQRHPTAPFDLHLERDVPDRSIRQNILLRHRLAIDDEFHRHLASLAETGPFDVPVRLLVVGALLQAGIGLLIQACRDPGGHPDAAGFGQLELALVLAERPLANLELHQVAPAIADVVSALSNALAPLVVIEFAIEFDIRPANPDPLAIDARKVRLATDARAEAGVQRLVPDIQFPNRGRVHHRKEIDGGHRFAVGAGHFVGHIHDVFIGADAVEFGHVVIRQLAAFDLQTPARMGRTADGPLLFGPAQRVEAERGPMVFGIAAGINLIFEPQQTEMAGIVRAEARDFDIVTEQVGILGDFVHGPAKELFLIIETRPPSQIRAHFQIFAHAMPDHVLRPHPFGRLHVMRAAGRVNVMIAGPPAELGGIDPALDFEF